jgi:choline dehydrogenase-like flavoprotein
MRIERVDVCVVGSGTGGSVVAWEAAKRGLRVLVLEKGPEVPASAQSTREIEMIPRLYKDGGLFMNTAMNMFILQGEAVGGSALLANMVLICPPERVRERWSSLGARLERNELETALDEVERELGAALPEAENVSGTTRRFLHGARRLGEDPRWMNKSLGECRGCGMCNLGCVHDTKRFARNTYLRWAEEAGARVLPEVTVRRVRHRLGRARGVDAVCGAGRERLRVDARLVVVAAGAIGSSALLLASGVRRNVGRGLSFNAGSMMTAEYDEPVDGHRGDQMTAYLQGADYLIEATHNPVMSAALTTPGLGAQHSALMRRSRHLGYAGVLIGTQPVGRVVMSPFFGHEEVRFALPPDDLARLKRGLRHVGEIFLAAGAKRVLLPTHTLRAASRVEELGAIDAIATPSAISFGSAHPQGGNAMSDDPDLGAVDSALRVHGFENLHVCDASVFPTSCEVNPIQTITAVAKVAAPRFLAAA